MIPSPSYFWIVLPTSPDASEADQYRLMELGASGSLEEEGQPLKVRGFFEDHALWVSAREALNGISGLEWGENPWEDWDRSWRERQVPVEVTPLLAVCPPWVAAPQNIRHVIRLEAKMAFGTGSHESTRIAALLLEKLDLRDKTLLDVGTGTGILSLYPALLGTKLAVGFDIDPVTGPCLKENLELNPVPNGSKAIFYVGTLDAMKPRTCFDVIVCNMIRTEAWPYLDAFLAYLKPGGQLILSGQRVEDQPHWQEWFKKKDVQPSQEVTLDEWWGFVVKTQPGTSQA
ncbi:MAG TPA: 50S ribosomal protein L11 methyltransferase [Fibrobacteres bacterium]|nr:50S ribosomal protein L11 methyltransferase [Fibrobacterota bacterium]